MSEAKDKHASGSKEELISKIKSLRKQVKRLQLERDVLKKTAEILKKGPGVGQKKLTNREKTILIGALRKDHPLKDLLECMTMSRSSFFYQRQCLLAGDKYEKLKEWIVNLFEANGRRYGYRRIHALLVREEIRVSEKVIRRCMANVFWSSSAGNGEDTAPTRVRKHLPLGTCSSGIFTLIDRTLNGLPTSRSFRSLQARSTFRRSLTASTAWW